MYALIRSGGRQYKVAPGEVIRLGKLVAENGGTVDFEEVLAVHNGEELVIGNPLVASAKVSGTVVSAGRDRKIVVYRYKKRKGFHKKSGHRQDYTDVRIDKVTA